MAKREVIDTMSKARSRLLIDHPFYATIIMSTPYEMTTEVPTAATDGTKHYYNPDFMAKLNLKQVMGVQCHESLHDILHHGERLCLREHRLWNAACDYSINHMVLESGLELPEGVLIDKDLGPNSADVNYLLLDKKFPKRPQPPRGGQSGQPGNGQSDERSGLPQDGIGQDLREPKDQSADAVAKREQTMRQRVAQAATIAKLAGKFPAHLERLVKRILNPQLPWSDLLREYMTSFTRTDESWARRNRRFQSIYLPTRYSERMGGIVVIPDTSGSMGDKEIAFAAGEIMGIITECNPIWTRVLWSDTEVASEQFFDDGEAPVFIPRGGGGTDMRVPLAHATQFEPEVVILITDGYTPWPAREPDYPLIVVCTTNAPVPVGKVIRTKGA